MAASSSNPNCCICLEPCVIGSNTTATVTLICRHTFHLCCIGCLFNIKGQMECPLCRVTEQNEWKYCIGTAEYPQLWETDEEMETYYDDHEVEGLGSEVVPEEGMQISVDDLADIFQHTNEELAHFASAIQEDSAMLSVLDQEQPIWLVEAEEPFLVENFLEPFPVQDQFPNPFPLPNNFQEPFPWIHNSAEGVQLSAPIMITQDANPPPTSQASLEVPRMDNGGNEETESSPLPKRVRLFGRFIG